MSKIVLKNDKLTVTIDSMGAEIVSIKKEEKEMLWWGDPDIWTGHAPVLFPICGGLKEDKFVYENKEYSLPKHGFAKSKEFEVESASDKKATFLLPSDEDSLKMYPFLYEFRITYTLDENRVEVLYSLKNKSEGDMYYSVGAHEAYACPGGIDRFTIEFEKEEDFNSIVLEGPLVTKEKFFVAQSGKELKLSRDLFKVDSLVFDDLKSRKAWLKNNQTNEKTEIEYNGFDYLLLWTIPGAEYICIEPWCGIPDYVNSDYDITKKAGIIKVAKNEVSVRKHSITF